LYDRGLRKEGMKAQRKAEKEKEKAKILGSVVKSN
jgi:hypothetical protein